MNCKKRFFYYKLFWIFVIGGMIGFLVETLWCWYDFGTLSSRTSNLFFPISCVWGLGCVITCQSLQKNRWDNSIYIFIKSTLIATGVELLCGWAGETILGVTFWDYTEQPFHVGKYINLPYCVAWGFFGILWFEHAYPWLNEKIERILSQSDLRLTKVFMTFMIVTTLISGFALIRMSIRQVDPAPNNFIDVTLDHIFPDKVLQFYFPKMKDIKTGQKIYIGN